MLLPQYHHSSSTGYEFIARKRAIRDIFCQYTARRTAGTRCFCRAPHRWDSRISAPKAISVADKFLQKQQEQPERRFAKDCSGKIPARRPRGSRFHFVCNRTFPIPAVGSSRPARRRQSKAAEGEQSVVSRSNQRTAT
jgi:hypothetical protein